MTPARRMLSALPAVASVILVGCAEEPVSRTPETRVSDTERQRVQQFWAQYRSATQARIRGDADAAAAGYRQALTLNPDHHDALYYLGNMELERGQFAEAQAAWQHLLDLDSTSSRAHTQLGRVYTCSDRDTIDATAAQAAFHKALAINQEETGPLILLGQVAIVLDSLTLARRHFEDVLLTNERSVAAHYFSGFIHWTADDRGRALSSFEAAIAAATPLQDTTGVPGEGDTKQGITPLVAESNYCRGFEQQYENLESATHDDMAARYRATANWVDHMRARVHR